MNYLGKFSCSDRWFRVDLAAFEIGLNFEVRNHLSQESRRSSHPELPAQGNGFSTSEWFWASEWYWVSTTDKLLEAF